MKKLISLLLALLMIFSIATVALAADEPAEPAEPTATEETAEEEGGFNLNFDDISLWEAKFGLKGAKILLKLVKAFVKIALALRLIDEDALSQKVIDLFNLEDSADTAPATETAAEPAADPVAA